MVERPGRVVVAALRPRLFALALVPLLVTPVLPLIDFYNHLARFFVLAHLGSDPQLGAAYQAHWAFLPDIGVDVIATPILAVVPPLLAAKLIIAGILAVLYGGLLYFHRALTGQRSILVAILLLPLLFSYILNWGFANFLLGLGFAFWAAGWWLRHRQRPALAVPVSCLWALLIFFTHGIAFALYGILVASLEVGLFLQAPERRPSALARALVLVAIQTIIPLIFFFSWETGQAADVAQRTLVSPPLASSAPQIHNGLHRLSTILRVEEGPAYWFDLTTFAVQAIAVCFLLWRGQMTIVKAAWPLIAIAMLLMAIVPSELFRVFYISDRMPLFAALCLLGALSIRPVPWARTSRIACAMLIATVLVRLGAVALDWNSYDRIYKEFQTVAVRIPHGSLTIGIMGGSGHHETRVPRCEMYGPLVIIEYGQIGPLFADRNQQPLLLAGDLGRAQDRLQSTMLIPDERTEDYNPYMIAAAAAGFDYLLVCNSQLLTRPFPPNLTLVAQNPHFALLHANR